MSCWFSIFADIPVAGRRFVCVVGRCVAGLVGVIR